MNRLLWIFILLTTSIVFLFSLYRIQKNPYFFWAPAIDQKHYGSMAHRFLEGKGFEFNAIELFQLSDKVKSLNCYSGDFLHSFFIALIMKVLGDFSFFPILYSTALYMALCVPLSFLLFKKFFKPHTALLATLVLSFSATFLGLGPSGQSEPLMFVLLFMTFLFFLYIRNRPISGLLTGLTLGALSITRPTGLILFPAFLFLIWKQKKRMAACVFFVSFIFLFGVGKWIAQKGDLQYNRLTYFTVNTESFGGPSDNYYDKNGYHLVSALKNYSQPILKKILTYLGKYLSEIYLFWGETWIFFPAFLYFLLRIKSAWFGFFSLAFLFSISAVVFYWYVPRVNIHLYAFSYFTAIWFLKRHIKKIHLRNCILAAILAIPFLFLLTERIVGNYTKTFFQMILAALFIFSVSKKKLTEKLLPVMIASVMAILLRDVNSSFQSYKNFKTPSELYPFQKSLMQLENKIPKNSIILSNVIRDINWFTGKKGLFLPSNLHDMEFFFSRLNEPKYIFLLSHPGKDYEKYILNCCGFKYRDLKLSDLWVYEKIR